MSVLPFWGIRRLVRNTLTSPMDLLVQDRDHLLARALTDKRVGLVCGGLVKQRDYPIYFSMSINVILFQVLFLKLL